jgi:hypothetical protein
MTELDFTPEEREGLWLPYWNGAPPPLQPLQTLPAFTQPPEFGTPLWEYLIDGVLEFVS